MRDEATAKRAAAALPRELWVKYEWLVRVVVDDLGVRLVEASREMSLRHGKADSVGNAGAERACGRRFVLTLCFQWNKAGGYAVTHQW